MSSAGVRAVVVDEKRWVLEHAVSAVPKARAALVEFVRQADVPEDVVAETELTVSELLANAVTHGSPDERGRVTMQVRVRRGVVEISVTDGGPVGTGVAIRPAPRSLAATRGRGLRIVRSVAHEWGVLVDRDSGATTVWASIGGPSRRRAGSGT